MRRTLFYALLLLGSINWAYAQKILYVGNSLTYSNDLPEIVERLGKSLNKKIETQCICFPNYGLEDHWNDGLIQASVSKGEFDYVIFQQGPSSQAYGRTSLIDFGGRISKLSIKHEAKPAYFMVWPSVQYYQTFDGVIKNHTDAAQLNKALLIKGGEIWRSFRESYDTIELYQRDQFHPSMTGSFLMALTHIKYLFPTSDLSLLKHRKFREWIPDKESFDLMIQTVTAY
ncbi:hypothetical protein BFP97_04830 [Roseivirga sp. 4D4]|uniref:hypothetical protein n=1 Tax=Roseivirga sp. 4D4 TaxID=1889784 RepID=UPI000853CC4C|nr:hypothetical protein [Roseivirga sp. 4D4]OEK00874.1 hypothetical protein BFP97_04830 [Roseivirga sp. 4D4]